MSPFARAALVYSAGRLLLFVLFAALLWSVALILGYQLNGLPLLALSLLLSSAVSWVALGGARTRLSDAVEARRQV